jgi:hypothetical protein
MTVEELTLRNVTLEPNRMHISGKGTPVNSEGSRNFTIKFDLDVDEELVDNLISRNWPVKKSDVMNKDGEIVARVGRLKVNINYKWKQPKFDMLLKKPVFDKDGNQLFADDACTQPLFHVKHVALDEELSKEIDDYDISNVKVAINLSTYQNRTTKQTGYCVYLDEMQFVKNPGKFEYDQDSLDVFDIRPDLIGNVADCPFDCD